MFWNYFFLEGENKGNEWCVAYQKLNNPACSLDQSETN